MYCFAKVCRLCLSHDSALIHCRARDKNNVPNYHKIKVLFPQLINKTSQHFPIWICSKCQEQVNQSYEFKQKCYKTYKLLRKYSIQLYEANKEKNVPNVPTEIFQEVKPVIENTVISLDEEDHSESYYNADDITIVKNELLPNNLKNEPEYNNMIQAIIDSNIETIRQIDSTHNPAAELKRELVNNLDTSMQNVPEQVPETEEIVNDNETAVATCTTSVPDNPNETNTPTNSLDVTAFTLDYTNASFETFASHVAPNITVTTDAATNTNTQIGCARVLRQRKSICYRTMEKCLDVLDEPAAAKRSMRSSTPKKILEKRKSAAKTPTKKQQKETSHSISNLLVPSSTEIKLQTVKKYIKKKISNAQKPVSLDSELLTATIIDPKKTHCPYFCNKCSKEYVRFSQFRLHASKCTGYTRHQCKMCDRSYASNGNLRRHIKTHSVLPLNLGCSACGVQYSSITYLKKHMQTYHNLTMDNSNPFFQ